jgi:hypothetical protein
VTGINHYDVEVAGIGVEMSGVDFPIPETSIEEQDCSF